MSAITAGQLWVSTEPTTYFVARVDVGIASLVPVRIMGTGLGAKVISAGKVRSLPVSEILEAWLPCGMPVSIPRTWHEQLLESLDRDPD